MSAFSKNLLLQLQSELESIHEGNLVPLHYCAKAIEVLVDAFEQLKKYYSNYTFSDQTQEILFFKTIKPQFLYRIIYYSEIYKIQISKPCGSEKVMRKFYNLNLNKLKEFYDDNIEFYRYYRSGNDNLDNKYFVRCSPRIQLNHNYFHILEDHNFSTTYDFKVAQIIANDLLQLYLENELGKLEPSGSLGGSRNSLGTQRWTASKVALVELIYALHTYSVFNNGASDLKAVAGFFEEALHINLGQFHRTFLEIRMRKSERTKFLNSLQTCVLKRMENTDD